MASVLLSPVGNGQQFFDNNGTPLAGGKIYTYQAGSSTNLATYTDFNGNVPNSNPIILDASGRTPEEVWMLENYSYKFMIKDANDVTITSLDNLYPILQTSATVGATIPTGMIAMWAGSIGSVPVGWYLCDGNNGTPDLRSRFIVGAGTTYSPGDIGGSADAIVVAHSHTATSVVTDPGHTHSTNAVTPGGPGGAGFYYQQQQPLTATISSATTGISVSTTVASTGSSGTNANLPPYYALAYIMKA